MSEASVDLDRRVVLSAIASMVGLACAPRVAPSMPEPPLPPARALSGLPPGVRVVGRRYLDTHPEESDAQILRRALDWPRSEHALADWHEHLDLAMRDDLEDDRLVELGGWQLTRTECRVYALAALLEEAR